MKRQQQPRQFGIGLIVLVIAACNGGTAATTPGDPASSLIPETTASMRYDELPVRLCLRLDSAEADGLRSGKQRLLLRLRHEQPSRRYSPPLVLTVDDPDSDWHSEVEHFAMHPDIVPPGQQQAIEQQFSFDLSSHLPSAAAASRACIELDVDRSDPSAEAVAAAELVVTIAVVTLGDNTSQIEARPSRE